MAFTGLGAGEGSIDSLMNDWLYHLVLAGACAACAMRARLISEHRVAWGLIAAAIGLWTLGDVYWTQFLADVETAPFPSPADGMWLAFYPLAYFALVLMMRGMVERFHASMWLDGLIGILAVAALGATFIVDPILSGVGGSPAQVVTNVAYPLGDLLLLMCVVGIFAIHAWRPGPGWLLLALGFTVLAAADTAYLYTVADGTYAQGNLLDALWPAGMVIVALAAWRPAGQRKTVSFEGWPVLVAPMVFALAAIGLLVLGNFRHINPEALGLALAAVAAVLVRTALTFREVQKLPETRRQAETDELTGLANRRFFYHCLQRSIDEAHAEESGLAVLMIDLDRFKELNDTLGHYVGDLLLKQLGPRIQAVLRTDETLARLGGDEFAILLPNTRAANQVAERVGEALERPFTVEGVTVHVEASIGIALYPDHAHDADGLLQRADVAMYQAKATNFAYSFYARDRDQHSRERLEMVGELREAISNGQLTLRFQPKTDTRTNEVIGAEALVRWQHPKRGLIMPEEFLTIAEQTGVMREFTVHVLREALLQCGRWAEQGKDLTMSVNISATNVLDATFATDVERLLAETGVPARLLQLEITEDILMTDPLRARTVIEAISAQGVAISLDDFGTGYSSLGYLRDLAVDELKIDRSFVMNMKADEGAAAIVRALVGLAQSLHIRVVAEGVEDQDAMAVLTALGCDQAQGFLLSRPLTADQFERWLVERRLPEAGAAARARAADAATEALA